MITEIKEQLINRLKNTFCNDVYFDIIDVKRIVNEIPESDFTPNLVEKEIYTDGNKLFDKNVSDVINCLPLYKDYKLRQRWSGYESNHFVFSKKEKETKDEIFNRLYNRVSGQYSNLLDKKCKIKLLNLKKKEIQDKIAEIDKQIEEL